MGNFIFGEPEVAQSDGFGFQFNPKQAAKYEPIAKGAPGIYVCLPKEVFDLDSVPCYLSADDQAVKPLYELPAEIDAGWQDLVADFDSGLAEDDDFVKRTQGYMEYCYVALQTLYKTACGKRVIDFFVNSEMGVGINPSTGGNSVAGASSDAALAPLAKKLLDGKSRFTNDSDDVIALIHKRFAGKDIDASLAAMASFMNEQPLYSLFKAPPYEFAELGFLTENFKIRADQLKDWFSNGNTSEFANLLQNGVDNVVREVSCHTYTRLMAIVALEGNMAAGAGSASGICFSVLETELNQLRPAAIGLGHELIHAYWAANGRQVGFDIFAPSTLLFEMKCVGLGPWADSEISENALREQWSGTGNPAVARRNIYEETETDDDKGRQAMRKESFTI